WNAFSTSTVLNKFNDSKTYFDNICNPTKENKQPILSSLMFREITENFDGSNSRKLAVQDQSVTIIRVVDKFIGFYKQEDFGVVKIFTEHPTVLNTAVLINVLQGFNELVNTGVKKVVLDLSDNTGGLYFVVLFINLLLFPNTYPTFVFDLRITEQMRLAVTEQFRLATSNNIFDIKRFVNANTHANFTSADDFFGNNVHTRGGV
ncbi:12254_t:CDS:2, partial [Racocetra persica]